MRAVTVVALLGAMAVPVTAQRIDRRYDRPSAAFLLQPGQHLVGATEDPTGKKILGGITGAVLGLALGAGVGSAIERGSNRNGCNDYCGFAGAVLGGLIGEAGLFGAGMQLADPDPDRATRRFLYPALVTVGAFLASGLVRSAIPLLFIVPVQFAVTW